VAAVLATQKPGGGFILAGNILKQWEKNTLEEILASVQLNSY